jgi:hypothetical protein
MPVINHSSNADGSGITEKIGTAAYNQTLNETAHQYLGGNSEYNVYSAELAAWDLGTAMYANDYP